MEPREPNFNIVFHNSQYIRHMKNHTPESGSRGSTSGSPSGSPQELLYLKYERKSLHCIMRTTIIYASKYGTTATIAKEIADLISTHDQVQVLDINKIKEVTISDLLNPDRFVLGVPIYAGKPLQAMQKFCEASAGKLLEKPLYLFVCGSEISSEKQQAEGEAAFSERLRKAAKEVVFLGGAFHWGKMNFVERFIIKRITGRKGDMDMIRHKAIKKFARSMIEA